MLKISRILQIYIKLKFFRDRIRTSINVLGDAFGAGIVAHLCRDELARMGPPQPSMEMLDRAESGYIPTTSPLPGSPLYNSQPGTNENTTEKGNNGQPMWNASNPPKSPNSETQI